MSCTSHPSLPKARFLAGGDKEPGSSASSDTEEDSLPTNKCKKVRGWALWGPCLGFAPCCLLASGVGGVGGHQLWRVTRPLPRLASSAGDHGGATVPS